MDSKLLSLNLKWYVAGNILSSIISMLISVYIIRYLPVEMFGIYSIFIGSYLFFSIFSNSGLLYSLRRYIPELIQKKYHSYLKEVVVTLYKYSFAASLLLLILVFLVKDETGQLLQIPEFGEYYSLFCINIFLYLQTSFSSTVLTAFNDQKDITLLSFSSAVIRGILYLLLFRYISLQLIFIIEAISLAVTAAGGALIMILKVKDLKMRKGREIDSTERDENRNRIRRYSLLSTSNEAGSGIISEVSDYYLISVYLGPAALGYYAYPYKLIKTLFSLLSVSQINNLLRPFLIAGYYQNDGSKKIYMNKVFNFLVKIFMIIYGLIVALLIAYQDAINIHLFKAKFTGTETLLLVILTFYFLRSISVPVSLIIETTEKIEYSLYSKMFALFNIASVVLILHYTDWGIIAVAAATGISGFLKEYYIYYFLRKNSGVKFDVLDISRVIALLLPVISVMYLSSLTNNVLINLSLPLITGLILFIIMFRLLSPLSEGEKRIIQELFNNMLPKISPSFIR